MTAPFMVAPAVLSDVPILAWAAANLAEIALALAVAAGLVMVLWLARALVLRAAKRLGAEYAFTATLAGVVRKTRLWFLVALALEVVQGYLHPPQDAARTVGFLFIVAAALQAAIWARALILGMIEHRAQGHDGDAASLASAMGIIRLLVSVTVFAIAAIVVLDNLGANVTALVAGLGVGGIAIGLAAQGIFSDLFAALSIIFDKPFQAGDTITYQGKEGPVTGTVRKIGLKSTRVLSLSGELRIIGNNQLLAQEVTNHTGRQLFRFQLVVGVTYQTPPDVLAAIPGLMEAEAEKAGQRFVRAAFRAFSPSSIDFDFVFEVDSGEVPDAHAAQEQVAFGVLRAFRERGIAFAYPTQTTFTAAPDGTLVMPYAETPKPSQEPRKPRRPSHR
jgi:small-conductance mechanosensitive channel